MKKTMSILMTTAMVLSMGISAAAAQPKCSIEVDDEVLMIHDGKKTASYQLDEARINLSKSKDGGIAVSFVVEEEGSKKVSLGTNKEINVSGDIKNLNIGKALDKNYSINLDEDADIHQLYSAGNARITVDGEIDKAYLSSSGARLTANKGSDVDVVYARNLNSVKGLLTPHVKAYVEDPVVESVPSSDYDRYYYYDGKYYRRYSDLGVSSIYDHGDTVSFYCDVSGADVYLNGSRIGSTTRGTNTFTVNSDRYWNDRLTISKDGYDTETIYLDDYYTHYYYRNGVRYWRA